MKIKSIVLRFINWFLLTLFLILSYNLFLKKRFVLPKAITPTITEKIEYRGEQYDFSAEKMTEKGNIREFYNIHITSDNMDVKAEKARSRDMKKVTFEGNIQGSNGEWEFSCDLLEYDIDKKRFVAKGHFKGFNSEEKIKISSDVFVSTNKFKRGEFKTNVVVEADDMVVRCGSLNYISSGPMDFKGGVAINFNFNIKGKESEAILIGDSIRYEKKEGTLKSFSPFDLKSKEYNISGSGFFFKNDPFIFQSEERVNIEFIDKDLKIGANSILYEKDLAMEGDVEGESDSFTFKGERLYSEGKNSFILEKNIIFGGEDFNIGCEKVIYDSLKEQALLVGAPCVATAEGMNLKVNEMEYIVPSKTLHSNGRIDIVGEGIVIKGEDLSYNLGDKKGSLREVEMEHSKEEGTSEAVDKKDNESNLSRVKASLMEYCGNDKRIIFSKDVSLEKERIKATTDKLEFNNDLKKAHMDSLEIDLLDENAKIELEDAKYDMNIGLLESSKPFKAHREGYVLKGQNFSYSEKDSSLSFEDSGEIKNKEKKIEMFYDSFRYNSEDKEGYFDNISGNREGANFNVKRAIYFRENGNLLLTDISATKNKINLVSDEAIYDPTSKDLIFEEEATITKDDIKVLAHGGTLNFDDRSLSAQSAKALKDNGDQIEGKEIFLDYEENDLSMDGEVKGRLGSGEIFRADSGKIFFEKDSEKEGEHQFIRAELRKNAKFEYKESIVEADYVEYDNMNNWLYARGDVKLHIEEEESFIDVKSLHAFIDLEREIAKMKNNVVVTHSDSNMGIINASGDSALLQHKEDFLSLKGHVKATGSKMDLKVSGEEVVLDLKTATLKGKGKTKFSYNTGNDGENITKLGEEFKDYKEKFIQSHEDDIKELESLKSRFFQK